MKGWMWKPIVAGFSGTTVHFVFMYLKSRFGLLPAFQPYQSFQIALGHWIRTNVPAIAPWVLSFVNGMADAKRVGLLHELVPNVAVIAMLVSPKNAQIEAQLADFQVTTRSLGRDQIVLNASTENEIDTANSGSGKCPTTFGGFEADPVSVG
jgi:hypothetical protein